MLSVGCYGGRVVAPQVLSEWGLAGIAALPEHVGVLVIVDVLSFSTAVDVAVSRGAIAYPFSFAEEQGARFAAERVDAVLARPRRSAGAQYSLSPASLEHSGWDETDVTVPQSIGSADFLPASGSVFHGTRRPSGRSAEKQMVRKCVWVPQHQLFI